MWGSINSKPLCLTKYRISYYILHEKGEVMNNSSRSHLDKTLSVDHSADEKLCSLCGLCMVNAWSAKESVQGCVFTVGWLGKHESSVFGRERSQDNSDEMLFGISKKRFVARIKNPLPTIQFT